MKFLVDPDGLRTAVSHARSVVTKSHSAPILANVMIDADDGTAMFRATDTQIELEMTLDANVEEPGGTTVPATILNDLARRLPSGVPVEFTFEGQNERLKINAGATDCDLLTLPKSDFPKFTETEYSVNFDVDAKVLCRLLDMSKASVAPDSPRKYLKGICLHTADSEDGKILRCVSSDGFRLSRIDAEAPPGCADMPPFILPLKSAIELIRLLESVPDKARISVTETSLCAATPGMTFTTRSVNAEFPDYNKLIPDPAGLRVELDSATCQKALGRLAAVVSPESSAVLLTIADDNLNLAVNSPFSGAIQEDIRVAYPHKEMQIKFNHGHLLGIFGLLSDGTVAMELQPTPGATVFTSSSDENALYVVMPIRV